MFDWLSLMRQAQNSAATAMLGQQFHLDKNQTQAAMAAFLPAFALGMQHAMGAKPDALAQNLFGAYQNWWLNAAQAYSPGAQRNGEQILDQIFGSDDVSRRVAHQAAQMTGVNVDVMQQMLPVLAGIYAGGLYHWMSGHARVMNKTAQPAAPPQPAMPDFVESWARMCAAWSGGAPKEPESEPSPFEAMMAGFLPSPAATGQAKDETASPDTLPAWEDMMEKGRDMQKQYLASLQSIFDEAQKAGAKKR